MLGGVALCIKTDAIFTNSLSFGPKRLGFSEMRFPASLQCLSMVKYLFEVMVIYGDLTLIVILLLPAMLSFENIS